MFDTLEGSSWLALECLQEMKGMYCGADDNIPQKNVGVVM